MTREGEFTPSPAEQPPEELMGSSQKLRFIRRALELLHSDRKDGAPPDPREHWSKLYESVGSWNSGIELSDNIRSVVRDFVERKMPRVKDTIPSIRELPDKALLDALSNNWFEELEEEVGGQRREVLLAVMAHVVKKVETVAWQKVLEHADTDSLQKLGLDADTRDLLVGLLGIVSTADQLFIRFLAYTQLSEEPTGKASQVGMLVPGDAQPHTIAELFPKETQYLADNLLQLAQESSAWVDKPGGRQFQALLETVSRFYQVKTTTEALQLFSDVKQRYLETVSSGFPILMTPSLEGYRKEPYLDPELRVSLVTADAQQERDLFARAQSALGSNLTALGADRFRGGVQGTPFRTVVAVGSYGVDLTFSAVAQESPATVLYLNEQMRTYDREYPEFMRKVENTAAAFSGLPDEACRALMERMSRMNTMLHEFSHPVYPATSPEAVRLGQEPLTVVDEVKAETIYRALLPEIIGEKGVEGTKEQWAAAALTSSLQQLKDTSAGDPYYHAQVFQLNRLTERGILVVKEGGVAISDTNAYYGILREAAHEVLALYEDPDMTEQKAAQWVASRCKPNGQVKKLATLLKEEEN